MPSLSRNTASALGQVLGAIGAIGAVTTKTIGMLDRLTDAGYSHADTFALNTELRNRGSIEDAILDEEVRDLERTIERLKHQENLQDFLKSHPNLQWPSNAATQPKPSSGSKTAKQSKTA